jgi:DNA-binding transcriptional LysR family regulator
MDRFTAMAAFTQVVDAGSLSVAARRLGLSRSAISKQLAQLENRLGARLLQRTTRRMALTEAGTDFYARCTRIVHEVEEAERGVGRLHAAPRGLLKVNAPMTFGYRHLAPAIADFLPRYPDVQVETTLNDQIVNVIEGGFDVTIRVAVLADSSLIARRLARNRIVVCGAPAYFAAHGRPSTPRDLVHHNCLNYTYLATGNLWHFVGPRGAQSVEASGSFRANNGDALQAAARAGLGLVQLPAFIVGDDLASGALETVLEHYEDRTTSIWALYPSTRHLSPKVRVFLDFLAARFELPVWDPRPPSVGRRRASAARQADSQRGRVTRTRARRPPRA